MTIKINSIKASNWTDDEWYNFICGLVSSQGNPIKQTTQKIPENAPDFYISNYLNTSILASNFAGETSYCGAGEIPINLCLNKMYPFTIRDVEFSVIMDTTNTHAFSNPYGTHLYKTRADNDFDNVIQCYPTDSLEECIQNTGRMLLSVSNSTYATFEKSSGEGEYSILNTRGTCIGSFDVEDLIRWNELGAYNSPLRSYTRGGYYGVPILHFIGNIQYTPKILKRVYYKRVRPVLFNEKTAKVKSTDYGYFNSMLFAVIEDVYNPYGKLLSSTTVDYIVSTLSVSSDGTKVCCTEPNDNLLSNWYVLDMYESDNDNTLTVTRDKTRSVKQFESGDYYDNDGVYTSVDSYVEHTIISNGSAPSRREWTSSQSLQNQYGYDIYDDVVKHWVKVNDGITAADTYVTSLMESFSESHPTLINSIEYSTNKYTFYTQAFTLCKVQINTEVLMPDKDTINVFGEEQQQQYTNMFIGKTSFSANESISYKCGKGIQLCENRKIKSIKYLDSFLDDSLNTVNSYGASFSETDTELVSDGVAALDKDMNRFFIDVDTNDCIIKDGYVYCSDIMLFDNTIIYDTNSDLLVTDDDEIIEEYIPPSESSNSNTTNNDSTTTTTPPLITSTEEDRKENDLASLEKQDELLSDEDLLLDNSEDEIQESFNQLKFNNENTKVLETFMYKITRQKEKTKNSEIDSMNVSDTEMYEIVKNKKNYSAYRDVARTCDVDLEECYVTRESDDSTKDDNMINDLVLVTVEHK